MVSILVVLSLVAVLAVVVARTAATRPKTLAELRGTPADRDTQSVSGGALAPARARR